MDLMTRARFPAGRLGAINGYTWLVGRRKTFSSEELFPLHRVARQDAGAQRVRRYARFQGLSQIKNRSLTLCGYHRCNEDPAPRSFPPIDAPQVLASLTGRLCKFLKQGAVLNATNRFRSVICGSLGSGKHTQRTAVMQAIYS